MAALHQSIKKHSENSYKTRIVSWLRPTPDKIRSLLSDGGISLQQAILWLAIASVFYVVLFESISLYNKHPASISTPDIIGFISKVFFGSTIQLLIYFLFCGAVHLVSKLFHKNGNLQEYLVAYSFFNSPSIVIFGLLSSSWYIFHSFIGSVGALIFGLYYFFWLNTIAIAVVYKFHRIGAFFLNFLITAIFVSILFVFDLNGLL